MAGGRPREHDREQIAKELIEWCRKDDSINLNGFCCSREPPIPPSKITVWKNESPEFRQAYDTAKAFLADRREKMLSQDRLHVKAYDLNAATYDHFLREEKRSQAEFESGLRKEEDSNKPQSVVVKVSHDGLGSGLNISAEALPNTTDKGSK